MSKSSNIEGIEIKFLKDCMLCTIDQLAFLYDLVLDSGEFPISWKQATIVPIYKAGIKSNISNNRPISLLPHVLKTFEKLIHKRIMDFISVNNLMNKDQGGFLPGLGTNDTVG